MALRPLLSLTDGRLPWVAQGKTPGINTEQKSDFPNRLFKLIDISAPGVPSIFSHPFVFYTQLSTGDHVAFQKFSALIKGVFLGVIQPIEINDQLGQLKRVARRVNPGFQEFVVLTWKNFPIGGTYPDCLVFPGAYFEAGEYGNDVTWDKLNLEIQEKENQLGPAIVRVLYKEWVAEIDFLWGQRVRVIQGLALDRDLPDGTKKPLWLQQLTKLSSQWSTDVCGPVNALADWTKSQIFNVHVSIDQNNVVAIPLRSVTKNIFCEKIIKFKNRRMPDLPVKSEFLDLLGPVNIVEEQYQLNLSGWQGQIAWTPQNVLNVDAASILLWPNFKAAGWNINYSLFFPSPIFLGNKPSLDLFNFNGENKTSLAKLKEEPGTVAGCSTNQEITHMEVRCENEPVGIFLDGRPQIDPAAGNLRVSLDFGTTHTCLGIWDGNQHKNLVLQDLTVDILGMHYFDEIEYKKMPFLPTFGGDCKVLPSELVFMPEYMHPKYLAGFIKYFILPDMACAIRIPTTVYEFKWHAHGKFSGHQGDLVKTYLKIVMQMALANLRKQHNTQSVDIVATYPLAFDKTRHTNYKNWLSELIGGLIQETGMGIQLAVTTVENRKELIGESYAGKALFIVPPPAAELVVDVGGGTTDIALLVGNDILALDSVKYGGEVFLRYLAMRDLFPQVRKEEIQFLNGARDALALQKAIRITGSIRGIFDEYPDDERSKVEAALGRFFDGLLEYLKVLLVCNNLQKNIFLYPMGNGWRFIEGMSHVSNIRSFIEEWFSRRNIQLTANVSDTISRLKEGLVIGANEIVLQNVYDPPPDFIDNPVRSRVGAKAAIVWNSGRREFQPSDPVPYGGLGFTFQNNPRFDTKDFIQSLPFEKPKGISVEIIAQRLNAFCMKEMMGLTGGGLSLVRSIYAKFLEEIYPIYYL